MGPRGLNDAQRILPGVDRRPEWRSYFPECLLPHVPADEMPQEAEPQTCDHRPTEPVDVHLFHPGQLRLKQLAGLCTAKKARNWSHDVRNAQTGTTRNRPAAVPGIPKLADRQYKQQGTAPRDGQQTAFMASRDYPNRTLNDVAVRAAPSAGAVVAARCGEVPLSCPLQRGAITASSHACAASE